MQNYRMYEQALKTASEKNIMPGETLNPFNMQIDKTGICPTLTTRPEGFKTAIIVCVEDK